MTNDQSFNFPPVSNGMDYLLSTLEQLESASEMETGRALKYATLHLQAATEVLLKVRLIQEHWSLVFRDPGNANLNAFKSGDFESCTTEAALERLSRIAGIHVPEKIRKRVRQLAQRRNALQHYGTQGQSAYAVEALTVDVLDFLLDFIREHLSPGLQKEESAQLLEMLPRVRSSLRHAESLVERRMKRIAREAEAEGVPLLSCPSCSETALAVQPDKNATCRFCLSEWRTEERDEIFSVDERDPYVCWSCRGSVTVVEAERWEFYDGILFWEEDEDFLEYEPTGGSLEGEVVPLMGVCFKCGTVQYYSRASSIRTGRVVTR